MKKISEYSIKELQQVFLKGEITTERLKLKSSRPIKVTSLDSVPIGNKSAVKILMEGDDNPVEFITDMKIGEKFPARPYPDEEVVMSEQWGKSFAKAINDNPKPMYSKGHEDSGTHPKMRAQNAGYVIGAKVEGDSLLLRNYYRAGRTEQQKADQEQDMIELKAGLLTTSIGDQTQFKVSYDKENNKYSYKAIASVGAQSNAIVESHLAGSEVSIPNTTFKGSDAEDDNKNFLKESRMELTIQEMFTSLKNQYTEGKTTIKDIEDGIGITVLKTGDKEKIERLDKVELKVGNVEDFIAKVESEKTDIFNATKEVVLKEIFADDDIREVASDLFTLKAGTKEEIKAHAEEIAKKSAITKIVELRASAGNFNPGNDGADSNKTEDNKPIEA